MSDETQFFTDYVKNYMEQNCIVDFPLISYKENKVDNYKNYILESLYDLIQINKLDFNFIIAKKEINLRINNNKKIIFMDLDETLIHSEVGFDKEKNKNYDFYINLSSIKIPIGIYLRPGAIKFIEEISNYFDIGIFTASNCEYADKIIKFLDPEQKYIKFKLYKNNCIKINEFLHIKDLRIIKNVDLKNIIILDNNLYSFANQLSNGIIISSFYDDKNDIQLQLIFNYLTEHVYPSNDFRLINNNTFHFQDIYNSFLQT